LLNQRFRSRATKWTNDVGNPMDETKQKHRKISGLKYNEIPYAVVFTLRKMKRKNVTVLESCYRQPKKLKQNNLLNFTQES